MELLLPYKFKKAGLFLAPLGLLCWILMQKRVFTNLLVSLFESGGEAGSNLPSYVRTGNMVIAVISFFAFLAGIYFLAFSKERIEDEMVSKIRSESFQFAAFLQLLLIFFGFALMAIIGEPEKEGMMLFFLSMIAIFWLSFMGKFHYALTGSRYE